MRATRTVHRACPAPPGPRSRGSRSRRRGGGRRPSSGRARIGGNEPDGVLAFQPPTCTFSYVPSPSCRGSSPRCSRAGRCDARPTGARPSASVPWNSPPRSRSRWTRVGLGIGMTRSARAAGAAGRSRCVVRAHRTGGASSCARPGVRRVAGTQRRADYERPPAGSAGTVPPRAVMSANRSPKCHRWPSRSVASYRRSP